MLHWLSLKLPSLNRLRAHANEQAKLILIASLPCYVVALIAIRLSGASWYLFFFFAISMGLLILYAAVAGRQKADYQLQTLSNLVEALIDGDYTLRGRQQSNQAFQDLLNLINRLAETLNHHKLKAEESQLLLEKIIGQMDTMLIATDEDGQLTMLNQSAENWLQLTLGDKPINLQKLGLERLQTADSSEVIQFQQEHLTGEYILFSDSFISGNKKYFLYLLTRAEKLLKQKERQAWQGLLRVLSHELNNSLTPISTFSSTLRRKLEREGDIKDIEKFKQGLEVISERAESLSKFITSYSQLSHLPKPSFENYTWREKIEKLTQLFPSNQFELCFEPNLPDDICVDSKQFEQVLINLFKNALEASQDGENKSIEVKATSDNHFFRLSILDQGPGISNSENLFIPFYSTKKDGSGIGLALCQQIILSHGGKIELKNREHGHGAEAILTLPFTN